MVVGMKVRDVLEGLDKPLTRKFCLGGSERSEFLMKCKLTSLQVFAQNYELEGRIYLNFP